MSQKAPSMTPLAVIGGIALLLGVIVVLGNIGPSKVDAQTGRGSSETAGNADSQEPDPLVVNQGRAAAKESTPQAAAEPPTLHLAAEAGDTGTVTALVRSEGVPVDSRDAEGRTPLMIAAGSGELEMVFVLLDLGADPVLVDQGGASARDHAARRDDEQGDRIAQVLRDAVASTGSPTSDDPTK